MVMLWKFLCAINEQLESFALIGHTLVLKTLTRNERQIDKPCLVCKSMATNNGGAPPKEAPLLRNSLRSFTSFHSIKNAF